MNRGRRQEPYARHGDYDTNGPTSFRRVHFALDGHFQGVVVAVTVGVVALAEEAPVLFRTEFGVVVVVRSGELGFAGQVNHGGN